MAQLDNQKQEIAYTDFTGPTPPPSGAKIVKLDLAVEGHREIFEEVFMDEQGLYKRQFPDEGERVREEELLEGLQNGDLQILVMMAPNGEGKMRPVAMTQGEIYDGRDDQHATGLIAYITKDPLAEKEDGAKYKAYHMRDALVQVLSDEIGASGRLMESVYWEANHPDYYYTERDTEEARNALNPDNEPKILDSFDGKTRRAIITGQRERNQGEEWCFRPVGGDLQPDGSVGTQENRQTFNYWMAPLNDEVPEPTNSLDLFHASVVQGDDGKVRLTEGGMKTPEQIEDTRTMLRGYYELCEVPEHPRLGQMEAQLDMMKSKIMDRSASADIARIDVGTPVAAHGRGIDSAAGKLGINDVPPPITGPSMPGLGETMGR